MSPSFAMVSQCESSHDRVDDCVSAREISAGAFVVHAPCPGQKLTRATRTLSG